MDLRYSVANDDQRTLIAQLLRRFSVATDRKTTLLAEAKEFAATIGEVRERLGNPFFYSGENWGRPENADESVRNYTRYKSHEPGLRIIRGLKDADRELSVLREQLRELGHNV
jgi:hypothetical protein